MSILVKNHLVLQSFCPNLVAIILAPNVWIYFKFCLWLYLDRTYTVRDFGCSPILTFCFAGLFTTWDDRENFHNKNCGYDLMDLFQM